MQFTNILYDFYCTHDPLSGVPKADPFPDYAFGPRRKISCPDGSYVRQAYYVPHFMKNSYLKWDIRKFTI